MAGDVAGKELHSNRRLDWAEAHQILQQQLRPLVLSPDLRPADAHRLARHMRTQVYPAGQLILPSGAQAGCLGLVVEGEVAVFTGDRADAQSTATMLAGSTFGRAMLLDHQPCGATLRALTSCEVWYIHRRDLAGILKDCSGEPPPGRPGGGSKAHLVLGAVQPLPPLRLGDGNAPEVQPFKRRTPSGIQRARIGVATLLILLAAALLFAFPPGRQLVSLPMTGLGQACNQYGQIACAEAAWKLSSALTEQDAAPRIALGALYAQRGELADAEQAMAEALRLQPDSAEAFNNIGYIAAQRGQHQLAVEAFERALALEPGVAAVEHNLARSLQALGREGEALSRYRTALALGAPPEELLTDIAFTALESGSYGQAEAVAREALAYDETRSTAYLVLGAAALQAGRAQDAVGHLKHAVALDPEELTAQVYLGLAHLRLDGTDAARLVFVRAMAAARDEETRSQIRGYFDEILEMEDQAREK